MKNQIKRIALTALVVFNIALAGGVVGAKLMYDYQAQSNSKTQNAVQAALKSVPVAQAASLAHSR